MMVLRLKTDRSKWIRSSRRICSDELLIKNEEERKIEEK
jgi:hypothetical protein